MTLDDRSSFCNAVGELSKALGNLANLTVLDLANNVLSGPRSIQHRNYTRCMVADIFTFFAGELPKELGKLINLNSLQLQGNGFTGTIVCPNIHMFFC